MKKIFLTTGLPMFIILAAVLITGSGCPGTVTPTLPAVACDTTNTKFNQLYGFAKLTMVGATDITNMDLLTHEYTFTTNANQVICKVGYQGNPILFVNNIPYTIEIVNSANVVLYSGNHIFQSTVINYKSISPVNITAGQSYTIRRTVTNYMGNLATTQGRMLSFNVPANLFPVTNNGLTITASNFYGTGGPVPNIGIPYIEIVFQ
ncbi:MAG: hypothetical protein IPL54_11370 [Chitinophagaceae bacterium]|nr:hypothetical protein [Chitinophagaceae bacterium]